jgi:hypothetical protein
MLRNAAKRGVNLFTGSCPLDDLKALLVFIGVQSTFGIGAFNAVDSTSAFDIRSEKIVAPLSRRLQARQLGQSLTELSGGCCAFYQLATALILRRLELPLGEVHLQTPYRGVPVRIRNAEPTGAPPPGLKISTQAFSSPAVFAASTRALRSLSSL